MKPKKTKQADLENFRKIFFAIGLIVSLSAVLVAFEWKSKINANDIFGPLVVAVPEEVYIPPTIREKKEMQEIKKPVNFVLVGNDDPVESISDLFTSDPEEGFSLENLPIFFPTKSDEVEEVIPIVDFAEVMPEFPGGDRALLNFISRSIKYPVVAQENGIFGKVYVTFVVDVDGSVTDAIITRGDDTSLNNEALRVINSMPKWKPGKQGGKAVRVRFTVPINFVLTM